jgi:hypothetical protein
MKGPWIIESVRAVVLQNRTFLVILISLLLSSLASNIKDQSFTAVKVGRVVAFFMLAGVPVFTVLGIIALTRLFNKNL